MYLFNPPLALYFAKYPHHRPRSMWLGIILIAAGLCGAAFATQAWALIICQGVMYAFGGSESSVFSHGYGPIDIPSTKSACIVR